MAKIARRIASARPDAREPGAPAARLGLTRARGPHLLDLLLLAPDIQAAELALEAVDGAEPMAERTLRTVAAGGVGAPGNYE